MHECIIIGYNVNFVNPVRIKKTMMRAQVHVYLVVQMEELQVMSQRYN